MTGAVPTQVVSANDLLRQLDDIRGLGTISAWPWAAGWWMLLALGAILLALALAIYMRRRAWRRSWRNDAARTLSDLEDKLTAANARETVAALSGVLRRIAIKKFSRADCAGLEGDQWLQWLRTRDPARFDWPHAGRLLIDAPYAPPIAALQPDAVRGLIRAAKRWVA